MAVTGWKTPGTTANVDRDLGPTWSNTDNAKTVNDNPSECVIYKGSYSDWLRLTNYGFTVGDIPSGSSVDGIEVKIRRRAYQVNKIKDSALYLRKTSGQIGNNKASTNYWSSGYEDITYGGATDTWNAGLIDTNVVSNDFGVDISAYNPDPNSSWSAYIDCISIRIYYTPPPPSVMDNAIFFGCNF